MKKVLESDITKISSKGQVIIPAKIRQKLKIKEGSAFSVFAADDMVVLKKLDTKMSPENFKTLKAVEEAWDDVENGRVEVFSKDAFSKEMETW